MVWLPPPLGFFKLNIDGASRQNLGSAGCGGIIWNDAGGFIAAFAISLGINSNNTTEFYALERGISLAMELNCVSIVIESDSKLLVDFKVQHAYREAHMVADSLAKAVKLSAVKLKQKNEDFVDMSPGLSVKLSTFDD
ncbi:uncharacterized protein LOC105421137 [Amborella trichopoda]|uniref:uncharacterized protein LOC105421137 n=1 Tax=Amborella trichopoda TaxID=13333 RepID=UPI0005D3E460|nr:uncharacterized protein LOC105421137 [Amborella trichopoda]|eukprot:XP_011625762.1 uncharacterized protein LOC105421137 [Amborella trichopoda]